MNASLERYFIYRATSEKCRKSVYPEGKKFAIYESKKYQKLGDPDGCVKEGNQSLIYDVYSMLWGWKKGKDTFGNIHDIVF